MRAAPLSLKRFIGQIGVDSNTVWRWRKDGILKTVNIRGRLYILAEDLAEFNRRAAAGEFAKENLPPRTPSLRLLPAA